jgi:hypothetical protein
MRYQERIYIQDQISSVRNRAINNFNMSSDICVFNTPIFNVSGATKLDCCDDCPETITPHDTYTGGTVTLPTTIVGGDCEDILSTIRLARDQARVNYITSGVTAVTNNLNIEVIGCTQVIKWRFGTIEAWLLRGSNGEIQTYYISDYTDTQNTIMRYTTNSSGVCCGGDFIDDQQLWNDFLTATGYTGTTLFIDLPYISSTSCKLNRFDCPQYNNITGATYMISADTQTIPLTFDFTGNTQTFIDTEANFRYEIYKYNDNGGIFSAIPTYKSDVFSYSAFSATNSISQFVPSSGLTLDGEFLVKGYYQYSACTNFLKLLGKKIDTINYKYGTEYNIYNKDLDYYFIGVKEAEIPQLIANGSNTPAGGVLRQASILPPAGVTYITKPTDVLSNFIVTLNGLVLSNLYDYTISGETIALAGPTAPDDLITFIYTPEGGRQFATDNIDINVAITSGATNGQGSNLVYFNTTTNKFEVYATVSPQIGGNIILMLNGVTLANNIDFYQSTSNPKRLILEGDLLVGDIITLIYFPQNDVVNGLNTNNPIVSWRVENFPQKNNGYFSLEVSTDSSFSSFYYSGYTEYDTNGIVYSDTFAASGTVGTNLYYRVKNEKNYETICGNIITTIAYSDVVPVTILSNSINSY